MPQHAAIHNSGWYTFCLFTRENESSLLLLDPSSSQIPAGIDDGLIFSVKEDQIPKKVKNSLKKFPIFYQNGYGPFPLQEVQQCDLKCLFDKIALHINTTYIYKDYLLANLALQLLHFGIKHFTEVKTV
ncbi:hypothetical protein R1T16_14740 [Flavobacterium sp. DG1-102-2]|uniref:hypothetical protein n=1 Tax=Flavobacterium sp. DG1-102-2 TaxID=3081663 RepID=UPI00294993E7|nr:hypothetical protein [Flavobacterium sp. DG1-102-2]MDV6169691.1 hypothetical protein [Flavobacterium sp. DG1-102-2]